MTELPDLPPPPDRDRALPPSGAAAALAAGRARRHRFLAGAGATTAVLVLGTTLLLGGSSSTDSLLADDPEPSAGPTGEPAATTATPGPSGPASPGAAPTDDPQPSAPPTTGAPAAPEPSTGPEPADEPDEADPRDAHVEDPRDVAAPVQCTTAPRTQVGPVFTGGAAACGYASGGGEVRQGGQATVSLGACQTRNTGDLTFSYDTGQEVEVVVTRAGSEVWRFSSTVRYPQGAHERTIRDGRCLEWTGVWPTELADGSPAPEGRYDMTVVTTVSRIGDDPQGPHEQGSASATVDVVAG